MITTTDLTVDEVQTALRLQSPSTVYRYIKQGKFPGAWKPEGADSTRGRWLIPEEDVRALRQANAAPGVYDPKRTRKLLKKLAA